MTTQEEWLRKNPDAIPNTRSREQKRADNERLLSFRQGNSDSQPTEQPSSRGRQENYQERERVGEDRIQREAGRMAQVALAQAMQQIRREAGNYNEAVRYNDRQKDFRRLRPLPPTGANNRFAALYDNDQSELYDELLKLALEVLHNWYDDGTTEKPDFTEEVNYIVAEAID